MKMKATVCITAILLSLISPVSGVQISTLFEKDTPYFYDGPLIDPPEWATHMFKGVIGVTDTAGKPEQPTHFIVGYCQQSFQGRFVGGIVQRNTSEIGGYIAGSTSGPFLKGYFHSSTSDRNMVVVGLGRTNETHCYFRLMPLFGPTIYIYSSMDALGIE